MTALIEALLDYIAGNVKYLALGFFIYGIMCNEWDWQEWKAAHEEKKKEEPRKLGAHYRPVLDFDCTDPCDPAYPASWQIRERRESLRKRPPIDPEKRALIEYRCHLYKEKAPWDEPVWVSEGGGAGWTDYHSLTGTPPKIEGRFYDQGLLPWWATPAGKAYLEHFGVKQAVSRQSPGMRGPDDIGRVWVLEMKDGRKILVRSEVFDNIGRLTEELKNLQQKEGMPGNADKG